MLGNDFLFMTMLMTLSVLAGSCVTSAAGSAPESAPGSAPGTAPATSNAPAADTGPSKFPPELLRAMVAQLGFKEAPRPPPGRRRVIPEAMVALYKAQTGQELDAATLPLPGRFTRSANTVRSFTHKETPADEAFRTGPRTRLLFDLSTGIPSGEELQAAELHLSRDPHSSSAWVQVQVHDIVRPGRRGRVPPITRLVDSRLVDARTGDRLTLDVRPAVQRWLEDPSSNHGLLLEVSSPNMTSSEATSHVRLRRSVTETEDESWLTRQPVLLAYTDDGRRVRGRGSGARPSRSRRAPQKKHRRKDGRESCRRHPLYVDFAEVGWNDWIVAPPGYEAYYCHGDCSFPLADHLNATNHAIVQTILNSATGAVPKACCVPTSLAPISMLYTDEEHKTVLKVYQDMSVVGCGCR